MNITTLKAAITLDSSQWCKMDIQEIDTYVRQNLARQLADAIINEDLIEIQTNIDPPTYTVTMQTQLKIIQE